MKKYCCERYIYCIQNKINGRNYIGQRTFSGDPNEDDYFGSGELLHRAIEKYGKENFIKIILEKGSWAKDILDKKEKYWIQHYKENFNADYNISVSGTGGDILKDCPELREQAVKKHKQTMSKKSLSELKAMYKHHGETVKQTWKNYSEEQRQKISEQRSKIQKLKYATDPDYKVMRTHINQINASKQSATQQSLEWKETIGKDSHRRQNIHVAKTFYLDTRTNKLYTLSAVAELLNIPKTTAVRNKLIKYFPFIRFIENNKINDDKYNFLENVITHDIK